MARKRGMSVLTRDNQEAEVLYLLDDGTAIYCVDGIGRIYYDTEDEAWDDLGNDVDYAFADTVEAD